MYTFAVGTHAFWLQACQCCRLLGRLEFPRLVGPPTPAIWQPLCSQQPRSALAVSSRVGALPPVGRGRWWKARGGAESPCGTGYYFTGDGAYRTEEGYYQITGRMDDVINISGHRLGTAEIEDAMADHPAVPETAVIGYPHDIKGEAAFAFIVLKDGTGDVDVVVKELRSVVADKIAKYAVPDQVLVVKRLPKTRSGKVMRRLLRKIVTGQAQDLGDTTTLEDPSVISEILSAYQEYKDKRGAL